MLGSFKENNDFLLFSLENIEFTFVFLACSFAFWGRCQPLPSPSQPSRLAWLWLGGLGWMLGAKLVGRLPGWLDVFQIGSTFQPIWVEQFGLHMSVAFAPFLQGAASKRI